MYHEYIIIINTISNTLKLLKIFENFYMSDKLYNFLQNFVDLMPIFEKGVEKTEGSFNQIEQF